MRSTVTPVLLLNTSFEPIAVVTAKRAIKMWAKGIARIEESYNVLFYRSMLLPSVVRLSYYRRVPLRKHTVSRRNIFARDRHTCQYCAEKFAPVKLTLDHVQPRSRGGQSTWNNLVTACFPCNHAKGDKTVEEAGLVLLAQPKAMDLHMARALLRNMGEENSTWRKYLYF